MFRSRATRGRGCDDRRATRRAQCTGARLAVLVGVLACQPSQGVGPDRLIQGFESGRDAPIQSSAVVVEGEGWRIAPDFSGSVRLFELADPGLESVVLKYRAQLRAEDLAGPAYLEMWVRVPGRGSFFSKGLATSLSGTSDWATYEIPFLLREAEAPDLISLNLTFEEPGGAVHMRDVALFAAPLAR